MDIYEKPLGPPRLVIEVDLDGAKELHGLLLQAHGSDADEVLSALETFIAKGKRALGPRLF